MNIIEGSIHPPKGFKAVGISCGLKPDNAKDFALIVSDRPATAAGTFTTNKVFAAPVAINREHLTNGHARV
ncbi:MAG: ornithine acetyltransferase, partial [Candidatus Latescibacteria bacterium]|nr:ornithine acetyltransferase [Candidatus Latescibacterota bacterium]